MLQQSTPDISIAGHSLTSGIKAVVAPETAIFTPGPASRLMTVGDIPVDPANQ